MPEYKFIPKEEKIVPRGKSLGPGFWISFFVSIISVSAAGGLYLYEGYLQKKIDVYNTSLEKIKSRIEPASLTEIIDFSKRIESAKKILQNHHKKLSLFGVLEKNVLKSNYFSNFSLKKEEARATGGVFQNTLALKGAAKSYEELIKQMNVFISVAFFENINFSNFKLLENGYVSYDVNLNIKNSLFIE